MAEEVLSRIQDTQTGAEARVSDAWGDQAVAERTLLLNDHFDSTTLETERWIKQEGAGGTVTIASKICTLDTSTASAGKSALDTDKRFTPLNGCALLFRALARFGTAPSSNNDREIGFRDDAETTKVYAQLGSSFNFLADAGGVNKETDSMAGIITPSALKWYLIEIMWSHEVARCWLNGTIAGEISLVGRDDLHLDTNTMRAYVSNTNTGGSTDNELHLSEASVWLLGNLRTGPTRRVEHTGGGDGQVIYGAGILDRIVKQTHAGETFEVLDGTTTSGRIMVENADFPSSAGSVLEVGEYFADGIYWNTTGGIGSETVSFHVRGVG